MSDDLQLTTRLRNGERRSVEGRVGMTLMQLVRAAGIDEMEAACGGCCSCATCHIHVDESDIARLPQMSGDEHDLLECSDHRRPGSRLACQVAFHAGLSGLTFQIAPED